jgi:hypothetical protein
MAAIAIDPLKPACRQSTNPGHSTVEPKAAVYEFTTLGPGLRPHRITDLVRISRGFCRRTWSMTFDHSDGRVFNRSCI